MQLSVSQLTDIRQSAIEASQDVPVRTKNPFFGVGPITDGICRPMEASQNRFEFERWIESRYRKKDDRGWDLGPFSAAELGRSMHRGEPADTILKDMMHTIHRYFGFPATNKMAVGLGGGHSGFTVAVSHLMNPNLASQKVFVDTPKPETPTSKDGGFFRQSWAMQILEMQDHAENGGEYKVAFSSLDGKLPSADELEAMGITLFVGVGHETTGATTYTEDEVRSLLEWLDRNPASHHAIIDVTSMLGAMPWEASIVQEFLAKCCVFTPFQKAIGGISGYFLASFTPEAMSLIEENQNRPAWPIPRQLKLAVPEDPSRPVNGKKTTALGPFYDAAEDKMTGGVINTYACLAFAETTYNLLKTEQSVGSVLAMNARSVSNRAAIDFWLKGQTLLQASVENPNRRGAAVTLLRVNDPDITDPVTHARIVALSKQLLGYQGITHPNGWHEPGLDVARYVNAFPGSPGDYRAWIGGVREQSDIEALLENISYAYLRAKVVVIEERLAQEDVKFEAPGLVLNAPPMSAPNLKKLRDAVELMSSFVMAADLHTELDQAMDAPADMIAEVSQASDFVASEFRHLLATSPDAKINHSSIVSSKH